MSQPLEFLFSEPTSVVGALVACLLSLVGTLGNTLTIMALLQSRLRAHPTSLCLIALAASDLLFCVYNLPLEAHKYFNRGCQYECLSKEMCKYTPFFFYGNITVSMMIMAVIAIHRLFGVFYGHLMQKYFNRVSVLVMLLFSFLLVFGLLHLPLTGAWGRFGYERQSFSCTLLPSEDGGSSPEPFFAAVGVGLPCIIILASYAIIYWHVSSTGRETRKAARAGDCSLPTGQHSLAAQTRQRERSLTRTFSATFVAFLVCFLPWTVLTLADPLPPSRHGWLHMLSYTLCWTSAAINPVIYCLTNKYYREAYRQLLLRLCPRRPAAPSSLPSTQETGPSVPLQDPEMQEDTTL